MMQPDSSAEFKTLPPSLHTTFNALTQAELNKLKELVKAYCGIKVEDSKLNYALRRAAPELSAIGLNDAASLIRQLIQAGSPAWTIFVPHITVNETYFLRENKQLDDFITQAVPDLRKRNSGTLNILSAACSTGEEAFSLSVLLKEKNIQVALTGIDIDPKALDIADEAVYGQNSFRGVPDNWLFKHFEIVPDLNAKLTGTGSLAKFKLKREYRQNVQFKRVNLMNVELSLRPQKYDAIFCRNVLIYFERATQLNVIHQLRRLLKPGGYLCLGHSELFFDVDLGLKLHSSRHSTMYQLQDSL
jgi:chemotaxis protein methyltransferase CheR